jgi:hypothetical protein
MKYNTKPSKHIGKKFGRLTILEKIGNRKNGDAIFRCRCDCGTIKEVAYANLAVKNGKGTVSCGCYHKEIISSKHPWQTELNRYIHTTVKRRSLSFNLTVEQFQEICQLPCFYCYAPPATKMYVGGGVKNGIDRVDPSKGYEPNNVVPCCPTCNDMKSAMKQDEFLTKIKAIYLNLIVSPV